MKFSYPKRSLCENNDIFYRRSFLFKHKVEEGSEMHLTDDFSYFIRWICFHFHLAKKDLTDQRIEL